MTWSKIGIQILKKKKALPRWLSGTESARQCRDTGSVLEPERSHMLWSNKAHGPQLLSPGFRVREPQLLKPVCPRAQAPQEKLLQ